MMNHRRILCTFLLIALVAAAASCGAEETAAVTTAETAETTEEIVTTEAVTTEAETTKPPMDIPYPEFEETSLAENPAYVAVPEAGEDGGLEKSASPVVRCKTYTDRYHAAIAGDCGSGVVIIRGGVNDVAVRSDGCNFLASVEIPASGSTELSITFREDGKAESDPVVLTLGASTVSRLRSDQFETIVGLDGQCHFISALDDYTGKNQLSENVITSLTKRIAKRVEWLNENMNGAELIYVIVPDSTTVFPETVPAEYERAEKTRSAQFMYALREGGATVIDLTDAVIAAKDNEYGYKVFHKTDSHWTEYGAWVGYTQLMNYIAEKFPEAAPRSFDEMNFYLDTMSAGDFAYYLTWGEGVLNETTVRSAPALDVSYTLKYNNEDYLLMNHNTTPKEAVRKTGNDALPSAYIYRDSYGIAMYDMLADRFSTTYYRTMWDYSFDEGAMKGTGVDYVIYILAERTIGDAIY